MWPTLANARFLFIGRTVHLQKPTCVTIMSASASLGLVAALLLLAAGAEAHPSYYVRFHASDCFSMPTQAYGFHNSPENDPGTSFSLVDGNSAAVGPGTGVCPGGLYSLTATYPAFSESLLVASAGSLGSGDSRGCANRVTFDSRAMSRTASFTVPCKWFCVACVERMIHCTRQFQGTEMLEHNPLK